MNEIFDTWLQFGPITFDQSNSILTKTSTHQMFGFIITIIGFLFATLLNIIDYILFALFGTLSNDTSPVSVEVSEGEGDSGGIRRHPAVANKELEDTPIKGIHTLDKLFGHVIQKYSNNICMITRPVKKIHKNIVTLQDGRKKEWLTPEFGDLEYMTYDQVGKKIDNFGAGLMKLTGLKEGYIALFEDTRAEWQISAQTCFKYGFTLVTVYANLGEEALVVSINETEVTTIITNGKQVARLKELSDQMPSLKYIIYTDKLVGSTEKGSHIVVKSFDEVVELGMMNPAVPAKTPKPDDLAIIMYTSGSTGMPKGVMITHSNLVSAVQGGLRVIGEVGPEDTYIAYLPLAHIFENVCELAVLSKGAKVAYGTPRTLTDTQAKPCGDLTAYKPTIMIGVPRVYDTVKKGAMEKVSKSGGIKKWLFDTAFAAKAKALKKGKDTPLWNALVFKNFKAAMGGKVRLLISGGAPLSEESQLFMRVCFGATILQGYGLTETCAASCAQWSGRPFVGGVVGGPTSCVEIKLRDVPELNYTSKDRPYPRGEICFRGPAVSIGYYKREELTKEAYGEDGWFYTGDIGLWLPDGTLKIIDRRKNLVKMAHGEYVAIENLESLYAQSPFIAPNGICIYADSLRNDLVALILPQESYLTNWAKENGIVGDFESLCNNANVRKAVLQSIRKIGEEHKKKSFELVSAVRLFTDEWTPENELLTAAMKLKRQNIKEKYKKEIEEMYASLEK